jgi:hypothetical protein
MYLAASVHALHYSVRRKKPHLKHITTPHSAKLFKGFRKER